jgi:hypothetical protein
MTKPSDKEPTEKAPVQKAPEVKQASIPEPQGDAPVTTPQHPDCASRQNFPVDDARGPDAPAEEKDADV